MHLKGESIQLKNGRYVLEKRQKIGLEDVKYDETERTRRKAEGKESKQESVTSEQLCGYSQRGDIMRYTPRPPFGALLARRSAIGEDLEPH